MIKVLVVGQTPPPYHGQALMIERLLQGKFSRVRLYHVRMAFSESIDDIGRFRFGKVLHLLALVVRIVRHRIVHGTTVLYYPPAGPNRVPLYRDLIILGCTRWMFRRTIFHFHVMGVAQVCQTLSRPLQWMSRRAFFHADAAVCLSEATSQDARAFYPRQLFIVPNGIDDEFPRFAECRQRTHADASVHGSTNRRLLARAAEKPAPHDSGVSATCEAVPLRILFVGILCESKGICELLAACSQLLSHGILFSLELLGQFDSAEFEKHFNKQLNALRLNEYVKCPGLLRGESKWEAFARADVFCFPTRNDAFPIVLLEAMSFELPVVATRSGGIPKMVDEGATGFLVDIQATTTLADHLATLHADPTLRARMGRLGREKYLREFTSKNHLERMEQVFVDVASANAPSTVIMKTAVVEGK